MVMYTGRTGGGQQASVHTVHAVHPENMLSIMLDMMSWLRVVWPRSQLRVGGDA